MKKAIVLFNLGGPENLKDVYSFLLKFFSDPAIIPYPKIIRKMIAFFIATFRRKKSENIYRQLGGGSPLLKNTQDQAEALQKVLGKGYKVFVAMRYTKPFISDTLAEIKEYLPDQIVLLPLYPHFSTTTTGSSFLEWDFQKNKQKMARPENRICCYPQQEGFIEALLDLTLRELKEFSSLPRILFSAHGLPIRIVEAGDPYVFHVELTFKKLVQRLNESIKEDIDAVLCYQSRVGPAQWTGPSLDEEIERAGRDTKPVLVVPLSFVNEHSETLVELDIDFKNQAETLGIPKYGRVPTVSCHPLFINGLAELIHSKENVWITCSVGLKKCCRRQNS
ncbi:MAG: ferrochelatase [Holosporales bacterium]|nr:ferrochelatase [Holosporales bacterium]